MNKKWQIVKQGDGTWTLFIFRRNRELYTVEARLSTISSAYERIGEPKEGEVYEIEVMKPQYFN